MIIERICRRRNSLRYTYRDIDSVQNTDDIMEQFRQATESKINLDKTTIILQCWSLSDHKPDHTDLIYVTDKTKVLDVWVGNSNTDGEKLSPVVKKIFQIPKLWSTRLKSKRKSNSSQYFSTVESMVRSHCRIISVTR